MAAREEHILPVIKIWRYQPSIFTKLLATNHYLKQQWKNKYVLRLTVVQMEAFILVADNMQNKPT